MPNCIVCQAPDVDGAVCEACEAAGLAASRKQIAEFYVELAGQSWDAQSRAEMLACARKAEHMTQDEVDTWDRNLSLSQTPKL